MAQRSRAAKQLPAPAPCSSVTSGRGMLDGDGNEHGLATRTTSGGMKLTGQFKKGAIDGFGVSVSGSATSQTLHYRGRWQQGLRNGSGVAKDTEQGTVFTGNFCQGEEHGWGELQYGPEARDVFKGEWERGRRLKGVFIGNDGSKSLLQFGRDENVESTRKGLFH